MPDFIFLGGAPGTGKTTLATLLQKELGHPPYIDFGYIREFHLDKEWKNESAEEEQMSFENLVSILNNYRKYGYKNVLVCDLQDFRIQQIPDVFADANFVIFTVIIDKAEELTKRIILRNDGWKDTARAVTWNEKAQKRAAVTREFKIDNSSKAPTVALANIMNILKNPTL